MLIAHRATRFDRIDADAPYSDREGYDEDFIGVRVALPTLTHEAMQRVAPRVDVGADETDPVLRYHHFSLVMNRVRRFCFFAASNASHDARQAGSKAPELVDPAWTYDPRIARAHQVGRDDFYCPASLEERHVHAPDDGRWGATEEARLVAYGDAFHFTNAIPAIGAEPHEAVGARGRVARYIAEQVGSVRSAVFAGPVFSADDPSVGGVLVPQRAWEVVVVRGRVKVGAWAFLLGAEGVALQQVSVAAIEGATEVRFDAAVREGDALRADPDASVPIEALASIRGVR